MSVRRINLHVHKTEESKCKILIELKGIKISFERLKMTLPIKVLVI